MTIALLDNFVILIVTKNQNTGPCSCMLRKRMGDLQADAELLKSFFVLVKLRVHKS